MGRSTLVVIVILFAVLGVGAFLILKKETPAPTPEPELIVEPMGVEPKPAVIGTSVEGREIESYTYLPANEAAGRGTKRLLFVGGVHGGYEWNSVLLAHQFIDYLEANPNVIPSNVSVSVIPSANPDGVFKVIGKEGRFTLADVPSDVGPLGTGRFNANNVDLNRNFDCKWQPESMWRNNKVSAGTAPFSEPEAKAFRDYVLTTQPSAVVFWHSQANAVYASECDEGISVETRDIMNAYSRASGYPPAETFTAYPITGESDGWLASINIPAITVELKTHETVEWEQNLAGIGALFEYYRQKI